VGRKFFGTDGIRGRVGKAPITPEFALKLAYAAGKVLSRADVAPPHRDRPAVLITRYDVDSWRLLGQRWIWNPKLTFGWPELQTDAAGDVWPGRRFGSR